VTLLQHEVAEADNFKERHHDDAMRACRKTISSQKKKTGDPSPGRPSCNFL
jgi:hypothetical protein